MKNNNINPFTRFCLYSAGIDQATIAKCSKDTINKYAIRGTLVWIPAFIGAASMAATMDVVYDNTFITTFSGAVWGATIYFIDRTLISTNTKKSLLNLLPRLCLALTIALTVSECWSIILFNSEIQEQLQLDRMNKERTLNDTKELRLKNLDERLATAKSLVDRKEQAFITETDGTTGTRSEGYGKQAQIKEEAFKEEQARYLQLEERLDQERKDIVSQTEAEIAAFSSAQSYGILASLRALHNIEDDYVHYALMGLRSLLLFIELLPFFIKLTINPDDEYAHISIIERQAYQKAAEATVIGEVEIHKKRRAAELALKAIVEENEKYKAIAHSYDRFLTELNHGFKEFLKRYQLAVRKIEKMDLSDDKKRRAISMLDSSLEAYHLKIKAMMDQSQQESSDIDYRSLFKEAA